MALTKEHKEGITFFRLQTERLDSVTAPHLKAEFLITVNSGEKQVVVDLTRVKYADSSGLGALLFGLRQLKEREGDLILTNVNQRINKLIQIAHLTEQFNCCTDEIEAIAVFQNNLVSS